MASHAAICVVLRTLCWFGIAIVLTGCASTIAIPPKPDADSASLKTHHLQTLQLIREFSLQGRIGIQTNPKGFSGSLQWQHQQTSDEIALFSPLGSQVASIISHPDQIALIDAAGNRFTSVNAETLTQEVLGWRLPLHGLADWALGRPAASPIEDMRWNTQGLLTYLEQDGWKIEFDNYQQQGQYMLPGKIYLKSVQLNLKLLVEKWMQPIQ